MGELLSPIFLWRCVRTTNAVDMMFDVHRFFVYLNAKGHIKRIIFDPNYYIQKVFPYHHDRSVQEDEYMEILKKAKVFPWSAEICSARQNATFHNKMLHQCKPAGKEG